LFTLNKTVSLVSDVAAMTTKTSQSSILMLCVCQTLIKPLLTYLLISNPGIPVARDWKFLNPGFWDWENSPGITNSSLLDLWSKDHLQSLCRRCVFLPNTYTACNPV